MTKCEIWCAHADIFTVWASQMANSKCSSIITLWRSFLTIAVVFLISSGGMSRNNSLLSPRWFPPPSVHNPYMRVWFMTRTDYCSLSFMTRIRILRVRCVRDNLFTMSLILVSTPPFSRRWEHFSKIGLHGTRVRILFKFCTVLEYHGGRFLSCIFKKKFFFQVGILSQIGRCR